MEDELIVMAINLLQGIVKSPTAKAKFKTQLLEVAGDIQLGYGLTPPTATPGL
jgi:hypothetical protein